jgi:hypothetical protein
MVAVGVFEQAIQATAAVAALGMDEGRRGVLQPGRDGTGLLGAAKPATADLHAILVELGVPEGEARFYALEAQAGKTLVVVDARDDYGAARDTLLAHGGYDVQSQGAELVRGDGDRNGQAASAGTSVPMPIDVTHRWEDVISRYEMLWQQHYGTSDATWDQMAPLYRWAWETANTSSLRGRPWSEAEASVRREWEARGAGGAWEDVAGPIQDVWEDVADEAALGNEGGADRRVARQGGDQAGPARDVPPPSS